MIVRRGARACRVAVFVALSASVAFAASRPVAAADEVTSLEDVLVTGERPGPGMWRISKGDHELWILGTLEPLPKAMHWRSAQVDERIAESQEVIAPPEVGADIGFFRGLTLLPSLLRARHSPDGKALEQELPHDLYIRWLALRVKYLGGSDDEHLRPMLAALDLYRHAIDAVGLSSDEAVWKSVEETAHRHHVTIQPVTVELHVKDPKASIHDLDQVSQEAEIGCLATTVERLETDLGAMRERANRWSLGDIAGLRELVHPDQHIACLNAVFTVPELRDQFQQAKRQVDEAWLAAAAAALDRNTSSFAVLELRDMLQPDGWLDQLQARGYGLEAPP
jgi:hypothetical protein